MYRHVTAMPITVDQRVFCPAAFIRTDAAAAHHLLHSSISFFFADFPPPPPCCVTAGTAVSKHAFTPRPFLPLLDLGPSLLPRPALICKRYAPPQSAMTGKKAEGSDASPPDENATLLFAKESLAASLALSSGRRGGWSPGTQTHSPTPDAHARTHAHNVALAACSRQRSNYGSEVLGSGATGARWSVWELYSVLLLPFAFIYTPRPAFL